MRLASFETELKIIKTICDSKDDTHKSYLLGRLKNDQFGYPPAKELYGRIENIVKQDKGVPRLKVFREDLALSKETRLAISGKVKTLRTKKSIQEALGIVEKYRKVRLIYHGISAISDSLTIAKEEGKGFKVENAIDNLENIVRKSREGAEESELIHAGKGSTGKKIVKKILTSKVPELVKTGFQMFDEKNGGLPKKGVAVLASNTGGGKTVMGLQLLKNIYLMSRKDTCLASFEMDKEEMYGRLLSNISGVNHDRILKRELSKKQKKIIKKAFKKFDQHGKKRGIRWSLYVPREDITFMELMYRLKPYDYKVLVIDYINLLRQDHGETQASSLGEITRQAKQWSRKMKCLIIILAQLTDDDRVKYSRAITENADNVWTWRYEEKERETHIIDVQQGKARNQQIFPFSLMESYETMSLSDFEGGSEEKEKDGHKHHKHKKRMKDLGDDYDNPD